MARARSSVSLLGPVVDDAANTSREHGVTMTMMATSIWQRPISAVEMRNCFAMMGRANLCGWIPRCSPDSVKIPHSVAWGDHNNDGFLDLFVANAGGAQKSIIFGSTTETARSPALRPERCRMPRPTARALFGADYDRDGNLDLLVTDVNSYKPDLSQQRFGRKLVGGKTQRPEIEPLWDWSGFAPGNNC